jgi:Cu2+-exporting ATPase
MQETGDRAAVVVRGEAPACYHCGLPVPVAVELSVVVDGQLRSVCCHGCEAVARAIVDNGLSDYYRHRDALPNSPREVLPAALQETGLFDHPEVQRSFVSAVGEHQREANLILEGITCAACVWLNEQHIARQPGVAAIDINYATRRARVRWDERRIKLSAILSAIAAIGYRAHPYDVARSEELAGRERREALWRLFVAGFGMMQVMMYAVPVYLADDGTMTRDIETLMRWASLLLTLPVVAYSAAPFFRSGWRDLRLKRVGMDVPVALGVGSAFAASVWATLSGGGEVYFDSVTMFVFLLLCGRYLEMMARQRAVRGVEQMARVIPAFAARLPDPGSTQSERVPVAMLAPEDFVLVKPGEIVPADGRVVDGVSRCDESLLTGESRPVDKSAGDELTGGSLNTDSPLVMRVERVGPDTRLAAIQRLMERAQAEKPRIVQSADRIAGWFVAALLLIAAGTAIGWWLYDPSRALWVFVSVLVVTCPCALSLATPAALTVAVGALAREGLLVTRGHAIETLARATRFVFDKTGTLTRGRLHIVRTVLHGDLDEGRVLGLAAALERRSEHAFAAAFARVRTQGGGERTISALRSVTGQGVEAMVAGRRTRIGRPDFVAQLHGLPLPACDPLPADAGLSWVMLGDETGWLASFGLGDELRDGAGDLVRHLQRLGVRATILSGDAPEAVSAVERKLGIEGSGGLSPQQKHDAIVQMQARGEVVAMVGDGVNDAPVLAQAQVSCAMGSGTDLARAQGDMVLLGGNLAALGHGVGIARRTVRIVRQNLWWAFAYNFLALPLAIAGYVTPWMAGIGMSLSSLLVVLNALRLQRGASSTAGRGKAAVA